MDRISGFLPDSDPTPPGAIVDCERLIPTEIGMKPAPSAVSVGLPALASDVRGAFLGRNLAGVRRVLAGTGSGIYQAGSSSWTDVSAVGGYTLGLDDRWSFAQFGDAALAASLSVPIQRSTAGAFAAISGAPKAKILVSLLGFVLAFHTDETTYSDSPDRWWCSALLDETDWTPSISTQCTTGRLVESGGAFTAAARLGDDVIAYKQRAMWVGRYVGAPEVWNFRQVSGEVGCVGSEALADTGSAHIFVGIDDIYLFDGVRPQSIAQGQVREWYVANRDPINAYKTRVLWDRQSSLAWIFFASIRGGGAVDSGLVYHVRTGKWGRCDMGVEAVLGYASPAVTYDGGTPLVTDYDSGPAIPFDSPYWTEGQELIAVFDASHTLKTLSGSAESSSFTTGDFGDEDAYTLCDALKVRFKRGPTSASATGYTKTDLGETVQQASSAIRDDGAFDLRQTARWHRFKVEMTGDAEILGIRPRLKVAGRR